MPGQPLIRFARRDGGYDYVDPATKRVVRSDPGNRRSLPPNENWARDASFAARKEAEASPPGLVEITGRPLSGAASNNRGNSIIFNPADYVPNPLVDGVYDTEKLIVQSPRNAGEESEDLCVTLGREYVNEEAPFQGALNGHNVTYHTALIEWGLGNATFDVEVDWDRGKTIVLCANYVQVSARSAIQIPNVGFNPNLPPIEKLSAGIGYGRGGGSNQGLKLTKQFENPNNSNGSFPAGESSSPLEIPPYATHFGIVLASQNVASATCDCLIVLDNNASDQVAMKYTNIANVGGQGPVFPIPSIRNRLSIQNMSADNWDRAYCIFYLAL